MRLPSLACAPCAAALLLLSSAASHQETAAVDNLERLDPTSLNSPPASVGEFRDTYQARLGLEGEAGERSECLVRLDPKGRGVDLFWRGLDDQGKLQRAETARIATRYWPTAVCALEADALAVAGVDRWGNLVIERWGFEAPVQRGRSLMPGARTRVDEWYTGYLSGEGAIRGLWWMPERRDNSLLVLLHGSRVVYRFDVLQELFTPMTVPSADTEVEGADVSGLPQLDELGLAWGGFGRVVDRGAEGVFYLLDRELPRGAAPEDVPFAYLADHDRDGFIDRARTEWREVHRPADWEQGALRGRGPLLK